MGRSSSSSSGEEDGDAGWRAAIRSAAAVDYVVSATNGSGKKQNSNLTEGGSAANDQEQQQQKVESHGLKLYQIKARKLLDDMLDKSLVIVRGSDPPSDKLQSNESSVRLFRRAPPGIIFDPVDLHPRPTKRPQIIPREEISEKSKKFKCQIQYASVDGADIMASANNALQHSLARYEARDAAAKAAAKKEEERVAELKRLRGEKWLPSIAMQMQGNLHREGVNASRRKS